MKEVDFLIYLYFESESAHPQYNKVNVEVIVTRKTMQVPIWIEHITSHVQCVHCVVRAARTSAETRPRPRVVKAKNGRRSAVSRRETTGGVRACVGELRCVDTNLFSREMFATVESTYLHVDSVSSCGWTVASVRGKWHCPSAQRSTVIALCADAIYNVFKRVIVVQCCARVRLQQGLPGRCFTVRSCSTH